MADETKQLAVPEGGLPSPIFRAGHMVRALADYRELQAALDESMPDQIMTVGDRPFRKKGYWRAIAVAFGLSVDSEREERLVVGALADGTENYVYSVTCRATAPNGRSTVGDGMCAASEKQKGRMEATEHNVRSHAFTRAFNRAVSNLVGFGEVSAEEVERDEHAAAPTAVPKRQDGAAKVVKVTETSGTNKKGRAWTRYLVSFDDGREGSTFDAAVANHARQIAGTDALVIPTLEQSGQFTNLTRLQNPSGNGATTSAEATISEEDVRRLWATARVHGWDKVPDEFRAVLQKFGYERVHSKDEVTGQITIFIRRTDYDHLLQVLKQRAPRTTEREPGEDG